MSISRTLDKDSPVEFPEPDTMAGRVLGHFEIIGLIGEGGMGRVYRARDRQLNRVVALKLLPAYSLDTRRRRNRLKREARAIAALNHSHIVDVYLVDTESELPFLAMEYLPGPTLGEIIPPLGMDEDTLFSIALPIIDAVSAAHRRGLIHRDIKPANIAMASNGELKLLDFGLAMDSGAASHESILGSVSHLTREQLTIMGTVLYMSPEQSEGRAQDTSSDVFSLGIVLHEMATGVRPFAGESYLTVLSSLLHDDPIPVHKLKPHLSMEFSAVITKCLQKDPRARYRNAGELFDALRRTAGMARRQSPATPWSLRSIAVLPPLCDNDAEVREFSKAIAEQITAQLSRVEPLYVVSPMTASRLRDTSLGGTAIMRKLGLRYLVDGSVMKSAGQFRIEMRLIDSMRESPLWSESSTGHSANLPEIRVSIGESLWKTLEADIAAQPPGPPRAGSAMDFDPFAYDNYLRARRGAVLHGPGTLESGIASLEKALEIAPGNMDLLRELALAQYQYLNAHMEPNEAQIAGALALAERIDTLAPGARESALLRGILASQRGDLEAWIAQLWTAYVANPADMDTVHSLTTALVIAGQTTLAGALADRLESTMVASPGTLWIRAMVAFYETRFDDAIRALECLGELVPDSLSIRLTLAHAFAAGGHATDAISSIDGMRGYSGHPMIRMGTVLKFALLGERTVAMHVADGDAEVPLPRGALVAHFMAASLARAGATDAALMWLKRALCAGFIHHAFLAAPDSMLQSLHADARFRSMLEEAHLRSQTLAVMLSRMGTFANVPR